MVVVVKMNDQSFMDRDEALVENVLYNERAMEFILAHMEQQNHNQLFSRAVALQNLTSLRFAFARLPRATALSYLQKVEDAYMRVPFPTVRYLEEFLQKDFGRVLVEPNFFCSLGFMERADSNSFLEFICQGSISSQGEAVEMYELCKRHNIHENIIAYSNSKIIVSIATHVNDVNLKDKIGRNVLMLCWDDSIEVPSSLDMTKLNMEDVDLFSENMAHYIVNAWEAGRNTPIPFEHDSKLMAQFESLFFKANTYEVTPFMKLVNVDIVPIASFVMHLCQNNWKRPIGPGEPQPTVLWYYYRYFIEKLGYVEPQVDVTEADDYLPLHAILFRSDAVACSHHKMVRLGINKPTHIGNFLPLVLYTEHVTDDPNDELFQFLMSLKPAPIKSGWNLLLHLKNISTCYLILDSYPYMCQLDEVVAFLITWINYTILQEIMTRAEKSYNILCWLEIPDASTLLSFFCELHPQALLRDTVANCPSAKLQQLLQHQHHEFLGFTAWHMLAEHTGEKESPIASAILHKWITQCDMSKIYHLENQDGVSVHFALEHFAVQTRDTKLRTLLMREAAPLPPSKK